MITSRGDLRQDVCGLLYKMSLADDNASSLAVRHAMNAITYLHLRKPTEALYYHMLAVSSLQKVINKMPVSTDKAQAIAASMLLSLYEVS